MKKLLIVNCLLFVSFLFTSEFYSQVPDSTDEKPVQYRRGIELQEGYQSYEEKYLGINLEEEKRRLFPLQSTGIWTELNPKVPRVTYVGVHFVNKDTGWAVGDLGALIKTTDGGENWSVKETNTTLPILKVRSSSGQIVLASGYDGLILRSTDGGDTFEQVTSGVGSGYDLWGLEMINDTLGWACGATALLKTTNGGESWMTVSTPGYTGNLWWIEFLNEDYGFVAGDGKVLRTTDGGTIWEIIQAGDNRALYSIDILDSLHIAAAGFGGTGYRGKNIYSSDGGYTWITGGPLTFEPVNDIKYVNRDTGYVIMRNVIGWKTTNRGQHWDMITIGGEWEMQLFKEENFGYSVGTGLRIYKTENSYENWNRLIINDNFADVFFVSEEKGFAISNILYRTTDGGNNWEANGPGGSCVIFIDSLTGFIGNPGFIWKTIDGGDNWYTTNGSAGASKIFFINQTTGWALKNNIIYKTTDSGENWFIQFTAPSSIFFISVYFIDSLYGWTANVNGRPYKTTDSGENWIQQNNLNIGFSRDIYFSNFLNGFIVESNILYKTIDGGLNWNVINGVTGFSVAARLSHFNDIIFVTGFTTYRSINSGQDWEEFIELSGIRINSLSLLDIHLGYAIGELGLVLKYFDEDVPVELISFNSELEGNIVALKWITATETNNQGFFVQRKKDEEVDWTNLAFINGAGTSTSINHYYYKDNLFNFGKYSYRLKQIDYNGQYEYSSEIDVEYVNNLDFYLAQNYPNPFNPYTNIDFNIPVKTFVRIILSDVTGKEMKKILSQEMEAGYYSVRFNSDGISSGVYFYKMITSSGYTAVNKLTIIK
jgi:photosystem II stability/assembly factor-like uncharacterized protein